MTVRRTFSAVVALAALLFGVSCSDRDRIPTPAETDEPFYLQGMQLKKQGRNPEALSAFLKVIEKRGARAAAESHVEAGVIYLNHSKDPVEAYHHFRKYLDLQPNSKQADLVRGMVITAKREFARTLPARPMDDQSVRMHAEEELAKLRRDNEELRAELATLRGGGAMPVNRLPRMIAVPDEVRTARPPPVAEVVDPPIAVVPQRVAPVPDPRLTQSVPPPSTKAGTTLRAPTASGRTHTVRVKETLYAISRQYGVKVDDLVAANRSVVPSVNAPLRPGMVLKIP